MITGSESRLQAQKDEKRFDGGNGKGIRADGRVQKVVIGFDYAGGLGQL
jgi:hypothetical protein